ncbi:MAG: transposase [Nitrospira sp.]|nr:transposase [Nitrospira sp.]
MKKSKYSEEQIATALRHVDAGAPVAEVTRKLGISEATYYIWCKKYSQMGIAEIRRLRQLEDKNRKLKQRSGPRFLDSSIREISACHYAACFTIVPPKYMASGGLSVQRLMPALRIIELEVMG